MATSTPPRSSTELSAIDQSSQTTTLGEEPEHQPSQEEIQRKPWKYIGYKGYTNFVTSDSDFYILRRFDALGVRTALALQDELSVLEETLNKLDNGYSRTGAVDVHNGTFRDDFDDRLSVLATISEKLYKYNKFILQQSEIRKLSQAPRRDIKSLRNWHYNHDYAAISPQEQQYLEHEEDLISIVARDKTPLRQLIDCSATVRTLRLWRQKTSDVPDYDAGSVSYYSDARMNKFASAVITAVGIVMLLTPIWILQAMDHLVMKLAVITVFVLVFLLTLSFAMVSKPFEALGATAAYAAVLMVFIQVSTPG